MNDSTRVINLLLRTIIVALTISLLCLLLLTQQAESLQASETWLELGPGSATGGGISDNSGISSQPAIALLPGGNPCIAWNDNSNSVGRGEIFVRCWNGSHWAQVGDNSAVNEGISNNIGESGAPALAIAPDGTLYIAWHDTTTGDSEIYIRKWTGSEWAEPGPNSATGGGISNNTGDSVWPSIVLDTSGLPYVAWNDVSSGNNEIYIRRWNGEAWVDVGTGSAEGGGISNNKGDSAQPSLGIASGGTLYVAWTDQSNGDAEIYVRRWNGNNWQELGDSSATAGGISDNKGTSRAAKLAIAPNGDPIVTWADNTNGNFEIYVRHWNGSSWVEMGVDSAANGGISNTNSNSQAPRIAIAPDNTPYISWYERSGGDTEIYVRRFVNGSWQEAGAGSASGGGISNNSGSSGHLSIVVDQEGTPYVAWGDDSSGNYEIYTRYWTGQVGSPTNTPVPTQTFTLAPTATAIPTLTPTIIPTATPQPTSIVTQTPTIESTGTRILPPESNLAIVLPIIIDQSVSIPFPTSTNIPTETPTLIFTSTATRISTPVPTSTPSNTPSATNTPRPTSTSIPTQEPTASPTVIAPGNCTICSYDAYNCSDFSTQAEAQACYDYCYALVGYDVHQLDGNDGDGIVCESLPLIGPSTLPQIIWP